jgi:redox-sensitive bicupin YhaK (pirin superfamily)
VRDDSAAALTTLGGRTLESWDIRTLDIKPHHPEVLRSDGEARVIAIQLPAGEELQAQQVHERAYLLIADGEVEVADGGNSESGGPGYLACFDPNERRVIRAKSDARLVLLLAPWPGEGHPSERAG